MGNNDNHAPESFENISSEKSILNLYELKTTFEDTHIDKAILMKGDYTEKIFKKISLRCSISQIPSIPMHYRGTNLQVEAVYDNGIVLQEGKY